MYQAPKPGDVITTPVASRPCPFGARHVGAIATPEPYRDPRFGGRIGVPNPTPNLFALPDPDAKPTGFRLGRIEWDQDEFSSPDASGR
jgi:hypothetical protein